MKNINKIIFGIFVIVIFNILLPTSSFAISGGFFKNILNIFKGGGDDVIKTGDELLKGINNKITPKKPGPSKESLIMEKVGAEAHASEFKALKESNRSEYIDTIRKSSDELIDNDLWELFK